MSTNATLPGDKLQSNTAPNAVLEYPMPRTNRFSTRFDVRLDKKTADALKRLMELHPGLSQSDIVREAILEKARHDEPKEPKPKP